MQLPSKLFVHDGRETLLGRRDTIVVYPNDGTYAIVRTNARLRDHACKDEWVFGEGMIPPLVAERVASHFGQTCYHRRTNDNGGVVYEIK
mgnify:CR=1 FL=1